MLNVEMNFLKALPLVIWHLFARMPLFGFGLRRRRFASVGGKSVKMLPKHLYSRRRIVSKPLKNIVDYSGG
jgi:hypothetical protein